jgi:hypothetical protein
MSWTVTPQLKTLAGTAGAIPQASILGLPIDGGFFGGYISHTANGVPTHALIVAPAAVGATGGGYTLTTNLKWADETVDVPANSTLIGASSAFDGKVNTDLMMSLIADETYSAGAFPAAQFCAELSIGGFTDWYLPARWELDIAYFNLKPSTATNSTSWGDNIYSVPKRNDKYTAESPTQTSVALFQSGGQEAFDVNNQWSSTEVNANNAWRLFYGTGVQNVTSSKILTTTRTRAFRRVAL